MTCSFIETNLYCVEDTKRFLSSVFDMKDLGDAKVILRIKIIRDANGIVISQSNYIEKVLRRFDMFGCDLTPTPMNSNLGLMKKKRNSVSLYKYTQIIGY